MEEIFDPAEQVIYAEHAVVSKTILKKANGTITLFAFDKGEGLSEHSAPHDAMVLIMDGCCDVRIGGESHILHKGQSVLLPANIPHALHASEKCKMMLVMIKE